MTDVERRGGRAAPRREARRTASSLPTGTVTFLFTDVEGSTRLLHELGPDEYARALAAHRRVIRHACEQFGGVEVDTQGDAFFFAFPAARGAVDAAGAMQDRLAQGPIRVRVGIHTGSPHLGEEGYVGEDVHRAARIAAAGHGGQVVLSRETREQLGEGAPVTDLGEHRVKDFGQPIWLFQLGTDSFPPLRTISNTNLPRPAAPLIGRESELESIATNLRNGSRLLTLTGPGGTGKTRLALEAGASLVPDFRNGVFWVDLAALRDPALVPDSIAGVLGAQENLAAHIAEREMLLVLDNFEQVVPAAPALAGLVESCPRLRVLVTSREVLRVRGEVELPVPPLALSEAVALFCARAGVEPSESIRELCRRLDSLPLAVELAAARTRVLSPAQILERLSTRLDLLKGGRDVDARQQTLRSTIAWSHDLLDPDERRLFARLAVFRGGWSLEAAERVVDAEVDVLQSLVEKSLVRHEGDRFSMLETIREFAVERLEESGEAPALWRRHAAWLLELGRSLPREVPVEKAWLDALESEQDNVRAALDRLSALGDTQGALELAETQWRFWKMRGYEAEARRRLDALLATDPRPTPARAHALNAAAGMAVETGAFETGRRQAEEALAIHRANGDAWGVARSMYMLGYEAIESGDFARARPLFEETMRLMREIGAEHYARLAAFNLAWTYDELGDRERAKAMDEDNLAWARATGNTTRAAASLDSLALIAREEGRIDEAFTMLRESLTINRAVGDVQHQLDGISRVAAVHAAAGNSEVAARLLSASLALHDARGLHVPLYQQKRNEQTLERIREQMDHADYERAWTEGAAMTFDDAVALALDEAG